MISILIPSYNYDVKPLVEILSKDARTLDQVYEILIWDDASNKIHEANESLELFPNTRYFKSSTNKGRTYTRQQLALSAKYDKLLFLDADVMPVSDLFLKNYIDEDQEVDLIVGGICYTPDPPHRDKLLRWTYGKDREAKTAADRNRNPYFVASPNIWIRKELFLAINPSLDNRYGMDNVFSFQLKEKGAKIKHIDNPVYHLGLEENSVFMNKSILAVETLIEQESKGNIPPSFTSLQKAYEKLKKWRLRSLFLFLIEPFIGRFQKNLLSERPNLFCFDLFKLYHYTRLKS